MNRQDAELAKSLEWEEPGKDLDELAHRVIGAAIEVHQLLGPGFLETVYEEALSIELTLRGVAFARQVPIGLQYKGRIVGEARLDSTCSCATASWWSSKQSIRSHRSTSRKRYPI